MQCILSREVVGWMSLPLFLWAAVESGDGLHSLKRGSPQHLPFMQSRSCHCYHSLLISMHFPHERHPQNFGQHPEWAGYQFMCQGLECDGIGMRTSLWASGDKGWFWWVKYPVTLLACGIHTLYYIGLHCLDWNSQTCQTTLIDTCMYCLWFAVNNFCDDALCL